MPKEVKRAVSRGFTARGSPANDTHYSRASGGMFKRAASELTKELDAIKVPRQGTMTTTTEPVELNFPKLPAGHDQFIQYVASNPKQSMLELLEPYKQYDAELRKAFAQQPDHPAVKQPNIVPVFTGQEKHVTVRARDPKSESQEQKDCHIMPLKDEDRKSDGSSAIVQSLKEFQTNFSVFSESSLADLDWSNVVVGGSAVATSLLSVPEKHGKSKAALRRYYHEEIAPASDVDLFLYGLTEEQAIEKVKQIEQNVRDALLVETTTVRMKNAITIASKHPVRHVQIVLRLYKSVSEILTGFDVDCSCAAYDGKQVYVSPRALVSYMTQINTIDLTRRSPSYENRLSKYAHRGFEIYWPNLDRSRIDPTIFERSFGRTEGLARLLILEKLPNSEDRDSYMDQRRAERGRPPINRFARRFRGNVLGGNIKDEHEYEVAEWVDEEVADYHTVTVPYGPKFNARKIEKLLFTKDMLLNAEWNKPKDREVNLHRHPAFVGAVEDVIGDCCGYCPEPSTIEEEEVAEEESKKFIKGTLTFMKDDPGRQAIGSFNPLDAEGWTEMAYVGNTALLCQAIVDEDLEYVRSWLEKEGNDPNTRDYTGRTPLHLAVTNSSPEIVQTLIDHGARMVARLVDGRTALHLAAMRGNVEMVSALLRKSAANEEEAEEKVDARRAARKAAKDGKKGDVAMSDADKRKSDSDDGDEDSDVEMVESGDADTDMNDATTEGDIVDISKLHQKADPDILADDNEDEPDVYDVNVVAWDTALSPLHLAIVQGHIEVVKCLVQEFGADVLLPIKLFNEFDKSARAAVLTLVLAWQLGFEKAQEMVKTLISLGASAAQADVTQRTALQYCVADRPDILDTLVELDTTGTKRAINHLASSEGRSYYTRNFTNPLITAIGARDAPTALRLLMAGAKADVDFSIYVKALARQDRYFDKDSKRNLERFQEDFQQPIICAVKQDLPGLAEKLVEQGVDVNTLDTDGWAVLINKYRRQSTSGESLLNVVQNRIQQLRNWTFKPRKPRAPKPLKQDEEYLAGFEEGTYGLFAAQLQVERAKSSYKDDLERYERDMERFNDRKGVDEKQQAINKLIAEFEQLEKTLLEKGAKTFYDLHPEIQKPEPYSPYRHRSIDSSDDDEGFAVHLDFTMGDLTDEARERYIRLFEAAWSGDLSTVKDLTKSTWKAEDGDMQRPLMVAVKDRDDFSPFSIAVAQGHLDLATTILEIAQEQHVVPDPEQKRRYGIDGQDEDEDSEEENSDAEIDLYSEVVDDEFTKEDVGEVSLKVESRVAPLTMLRWSCDLSHWAKDPAPGPEKKSTNGFSYFGPRKPHALADKAAKASDVRLPSEDMVSKYEAKTISDPNTLLQLAMHNNDSALLNYLLEVGREYTRNNKAVPEEKRSTFFEISHDEPDYRYALEVGRPHFFMEMAKQTGLGLPINDLVKEYGIEVKEKPKHYQGLTVRGRKRTEWATRGGVVSSGPRARTPPLLNSIGYASLELVEWWLSDAPLRCYNEFAAANKYDKRIQRLVGSKTGFENTVQKFLTTDANLAIHTAVETTPPTIESMKLLHYLIKIMPEHIETKNSGGQTPLDCAFTRYHEDAARLLIDAGGNQMCRDSIGRNVVHSLLATRDPYKSERVAEFKTMLSLIDKRLVKEMFVQRSQSLTPLASWIEKSSHVGSGDSGEAVRTILSYSEGEDLKLINGEGDSPLHYAVKTDNLALAKIILDQESTLLNRENATGRTPFEMAEDAMIADKCNDPPPMPGRGEFENRRSIRYGLPRDWHFEIISNAEENFVDDTPQQSDKLKVWELLQQTRSKLIDEGKAKRRLVTLHEANEVARRLAEAKKKENHGRRRRYSE